MIWCASSSSTMEARRAGRCDRVPSSTRETLGGVRTLSTRNIICSGQVGTIPQRQLPNGAAVLERPVPGLRAAGQPLSRSHRRRGAGDGRLRLGARRSLLRHCAPLRSRPVGTAPRRGPGVPSARCVRDLLEGRAAARAHREPRGAGRRRLRRARHAPSRVGLQPRWDTSLAHGEPRAAGPRSGRHRLPPRPGRALGWKCSRPATRRSPNCATRAS